MQDTEPKNRNLKPVFFCKTEPVIFLPTAQCTPLVFVQKVLLALHLNYCAAFQSLYDFQDKSAYFRHLITSCKFQDECEACVGDLVINLAVGCSSFRWQ